MSMLTVMVRVPAGNEPLVERGNSAVIPLRSCSVTGPRVAVEIVAPAAFLNCAVRMALSPWVIKPPRYAEKSYCTPPPSIMPPAELTSISWLALEEPLFGPPANMLLPRFTGPGVVSTGWPGDCQTIVVKLPVRVQPGTVTAMLSLSAPRAASPFPFTMRLTPNREAPVLSGIGLGAGGGGIVGIV